ncbi:hypothetical protein DL93DRAFT_2072008 [Clavulina sp. PMI_390]|nr:hypothetical protein DL93DRAFT_2072008 [Clavulina sp. PMI_390]
MPFGVAHTIILQLAKWAVDGFFDDVVVLNPENVPKSGAVIIASTHHNMAVDPMVLSASFPHGRKLHYWAKAELFGNPVMRKILLNAGNVPVYRKAKDAQSLHKGTWDVLEAGEVVAIFPEGTSYTEPRVMQIKDGISWTALEYFKWLETPEGQKSPTKEVTIVPCSIVYTDKSRYRSRAVVEYGEPISVRDYAAQFLSGEEGAEKAAVKELTKQWATHIVRSTLNAPDWGTLIAAKTARSLLWSSDEAIPLKDWVEVNQTLCDLFCEPSPSPTLNQAKADLLKYDALLRSSRLSNTALSQLPLPRSLDPSQPAPLPSRIRTLWVLFIDTFASILRLPFFLLPLIVHMPVYVVGRAGATLVEEEEESKAQIKIILGLLSLTFIYPAVFFFLWTLLWFSPPGFLVAALTLSGFAVYHTRLIDDNYTHAKRLIAAWRVLIGVWGPRAWDMPAASLEKVTKFVPPPPNPWLDVNKPPKEAPPTDANGNPDVKPVVKKPKEAAPKAPKKKKIASRHLVRHVLRARVRASQSLSLFLEEIAHSDGDVRASAHLAALYPSSIAFYDVNGEQQDHPSISVVTDETPANGVKVSGSQFLMSAQGPTKVRAAREVMHYLKEHGARVGALMDGAGGSGMGEGAWAAAEASSGEDS